MSTRPQAVWWHCWGCASNIRSFTQPLNCTLCGSWEVVEFRFSEPSHGQEVMFKVGEVDGDLVHPDDVEGRLREIVQALLRLRDSFAMTDEDRRVLSHRAVRAREHWIPFTGFIHNGRSVGVKSLE